MQIRAQPCGKPRYLTQSHTKAHADATPFNLSCPSTPPMHTQSPTRDYPAGYMLCTSTSPCLECGADFRPCAPTTKATSVLFDGNVDCHCRYGPQTCSFRVRDRVGTNASTIPQYIPIWKYLLVPSDLVLSLRFGYNMKLTQLSPNMSVSRFPHRIYRPNSIP